MKRLGRGDVAGVAAEVHHVKTAVGQRLVQRLRTGPRHQHVIACADNLNRRDNARGALAIIGVFQRPQPAQQVFGALKMGVMQRFFGFEARLILLRPRRRVEKQRLRGDIRCRAAVEQQPLAGFKAAARPKC